MGASALLLCSDAYPIMVTAVFHTARIAPPVMPPATLVTQVSAWADATIRRATPNNNDGHNEVLWLTKSFERALCDFRPVLAFVSSNTARAHLYLFNVAGNDGDDADFTWNAHLLTNIWDEVGVTWSNRTATALWARTGGDYSNLVASGELYCHDEEYHTFDITPAVQAYGSSPGAYAGILLRCLADYDPEPCYASVDNVYAAEQLGLWQEAALQQPFLYAIFDDGTAPDVYPAFFSIRLSNDFATVILRWTNAAPVTVLVCTNRYYSTDPADWFVRAQNVSGMWADVLAASTPSVYYRLVSYPHNWYTSAYAVAKFTVSIPRSDGITPAESWVACPLELLDDHGNTLPYMSFDDLQLQMAVTDEPLLARRDIVASQSEIGGEMITARRAAGAWTGVTHPDATNFYAGRGYRIIVCPYHQGTPLPLTFVGRVPVHEMMTFAVPHSDGTEWRESWLVYPYPAATSADQAGIANVLVSEPELARRDILSSQNGIGGDIITARRAVDIWQPVTDPAATNMVAGQMYRLLISPFHTGATTNWFCPRPY